MRHCALVVLLLLVSLGLPRCPAQAQDGQAYSDEATSAQDEAAAEEQEVTPVSVTGRAVVDLAQAVSNAVSNLGAIPDWVPVTTSTGRQSIAATDAFVLLARTMYRWDTDGELPGTVSITLGAVSPPVLDPQDVTTGSVDPNAGREIPTDLFVSQAGECLRWVDQLQVIPTAVWVNGERLSAAEYMAGLAICLEYSYYSGHLDDTLYLPGYASPPAWVEHTELLTGAGASGASGGETLAPSITPPVTAEASAPRLLQPRLALLPPPGAKVSGKVDLVVSYSGPPAEFVTFAVDGQTKGITNAPPYGYRWDTTKLKPGRHQVIVRAIGEQNAEIAAQSATYVLVAPKPPQPTAPRSAKPPVQKPKP